MSGAAIWHAARALVGTRFRACGHDPATGLDCVGLVAAAHAGAGQSVPPLPTYRWRDTRGDEAAAMLRAAGLVEVDDGKVLLAMMATRQPHLMIAGRTSAIHAHAGLRRVVEMPFDFSTGDASRWRMAGQGRSD